MRQLPPLLFIAFTVFACSSKSPDPITGKWDMIAVRIHNEDASPQLNPMQDRWIHFHEDRTFTSGSGNGQENAGAYQLNLLDHGLHLDSDAGPGDDSNWRLTFRGDTLLMRGIGTARQEASEVVMVPAE